MVFEPFVYQLVYCFDYLIEFIGFLQKTISRFVIKMSTRQVAIIGCGAIGDILARYIEKGEAGNTEVVALFDFEEEKAEDVAKNVSNSPQIVERIDDILENEDVDIVIEAASQQAVSNYTLDILEAGKDFLILSVGALSDTSFYERVEEVAEESGSRIYIPSGAILGLDGVQAAAIPGISEAVITTRKPPETLSQTRYAKGREIDFTELREPEIIFEGSASEAVLEFPSSLNVAASLSLAGEGFEETTVRIVADPALDQNVHEIEFRGEAGEFRTVAHNYPSPENPKTSYLAALSAVRTLKNMTNPVLIGV